MFEKFDRLAYVCSTFIRYGLLNLVGSKASAQVVLFDRLSSLGGIYVKFLQLLVLEDGVAEIKAEKFRDMLTVYDQVKYEPIDIESTLSEELCQNRELIVLSNTEPFAAGSFAQVYAASMNGQPVVIKVLRPSVRKFLRFDLSLLSVAVRVVSALQIQGVLDLVSVYSGFKDMTLQEVDYKNEVINALALRKRVENHPTIYIPETYPSLSTEFIIIQERIQGWPLTNLFSATDILDKFAYTKKVLGTDINFVMEELAVEFLESSLSTCGAHADPHPGNIYLLPNNRVALIDFGIRGAVQKHQPELLRLIRQYVELYKGVFDPEKFSLAMIGYYVPELTSSIQTLGAYFDKTDLLSKTMDEISQSISRTLSGTVGDPAVALLIDQYKMTNLFMQVINKGNRFGLKLNIETPTFVRSTQIFMQITRRLGCDMQLLRRAWERVLNENVDTKPSLNISYDGRSIDDSLHVIAGWLDRLCYSDPRLYNNIMRTWGGLI